MAAPGARLHFPNFVNKHAVLVSRGLNTFQLWFIKQIVYFLTQSCPSACLICFLRLRERLCGFAQLFLEVVGEGVSEPQNSADNC